MSEEEEVLLMTLNQLKMAVQIVHQYDYDKLQEWFRKHSDKMPVELREPARTLLNGCHAFDRHMTDEARKAMQRIRTEKPSFTHHPEEN